MDLIIPIPIRFLITPIRLNTILVMEVEFGLVVHKRYRDLAGEIAKVIPSTSNPIGIDLD